MTYKWQCTFSRKKRSPALARGRTRPRACVVAARVRAPFRPSFRASVRSVERRCPCIRSDGATRTRERRMKGMLRRYRARRALEKDATLSGSVLVVFSGSSPRHPYDLSPMQYIFSLRFRSLPLTVSFFSVLPTECRVRTCAAACNFPVEFEMAIYAADTASRGPGLARRPVCLLLYYV